MAQADLSGIFRGDLDFYDPIHGSFGPHESLNGISSGSAVLHSSRRYQTHRPLRVTSVIQEAASIHCVQAMRPNSDVLHYSR